MSDKLTKAPREQKKDSQKIANEDLNKVSGGRKEFTPKRPVFKKPRE